MNVSDKTIEGLINTLNDKYVLNLISQVDARSILEQTGERKEDYPNFDVELTTKNTYLAYMEMASGCALLKRKNEKGRKLLEQAGKILSDTYCYGEDEEGKAIHLLCAALALYIAQQYSRAYVVLSRQKNKDPLSEMIYLFLRKDIDKLEDKATELFFIECKDDDDVIVVEIARIFLSLIAYLRVGDSNVSYNMDDLFEKLISLSVLNCEPYYWILIKMLTYAIDEIKENSLWHVLPTLIGESSILDLYIKILSNKKNPVVELWPSQIEGIIKMHSNTNGAVINLKTSGGKTRVAEIAIVESLIRDKNKKILYLAPFRSLAFEVEQGFEAIFGQMNLNVSRLYGGATASSSEIDLVEASEILIMTPEKAKAIFRSQKSIGSSIGLIIIDEGHLISTEKRDIKNEIFDTHLIQSCRKNGAKILFLSAVLPNASDIAAWIADDASAVAFSDYKPSLERPGYLFWNGKNVSLRWKSDQELFNNSFVVKTRYGRNVFPKNKREAIAATAVKLSNAGPVMIYSAVAKSVEGIAKAILDYIRLTKAENAFEWDSAYWNDFEAACSEELSDDDTIMVAAKKGIICHSNRLPSGVRIAIEKLMKSQAPRIIVASPTLAQGVNVGISTVIIATPYCDGEPISKRDFWNICGRAGRAYCDSEGKILFAIDTTEEKWKVEKLKKLGSEYFKADKLEGVKSGLLELVAVTIKIAQQEGIAFEVLLDMFSEDNMSWNSDSGKTIIDYWDWIDDELLSIDNDPILEGHFANAVRKSLFYVQADKDQKEQCVKVLEARLHGLKKRYGNLINKIVVTGMQVRSADKLYKSMHVLEQFATEYAKNRQDGCADSAERFFEKFDRWIVEVLIDCLDQDDVPSIEELNQVRALWINGKTIKEIRILNKKVDGTIKDYYQNLAPWILHSISQLFLEDGKDEISLVYSELTNISECGLPTITATNIFYAGIHSRYACLELSQISTFMGLKINEIKKKLTEDISDVSDNAKRHLKLYKQEIENNKKVDGPQLSVHVYGEKLPDYLYIRRVNEEVFLMSSSGEKYTYADDSGYVHKEMYRCKGCYLMRVGETYALRKYGR